MKSTGEEGKVPIVCVSKVIPLGLGTDLVLVSKLILPQFQNELFLGLQPRILSLSLIAEPTPGDLRTPLAQLIERLYRLP